MNHKIQKGQYGYRSYLRKSQIIKVAIGAAAILLQLAARALTGNQAAKNILTVMAILSVLPTANVASPMLAAWKWKTPSEDFHRALAAYEDKGIVLYELIVTTREQVLPFDGILVHPMGVFAYCVNPKTDVQKAQKALNEIFRAHKLDENIKVIKDEKQFFNRLKSLKPMSESEDDGSVEYGAGVLKNLSM